MGNHVIYDRMWESKKLANCSRNAALAYPWIYLVADDHGRFEYLPRVIWAKVFGAREDVKASEVAAWLDEYQERGLMERYTAAGVEVCRWVGFVGKPPTRRSASLLPDENGIIDSEGLNGRGRFHRAAAEQRSATGSVHRKLEVGSRNGEDGERKPPQADAPSSPPDHGRSVSPPTTTVAQDAQVDYTRAVFEAIAERGGTQTPSSADFDVVRRWFEAGIPLRVALTGIRECSKAPHVRYVDAAVRQEHARVSRALSASSSTPSEAPPPLVEAAARQAMEPATVAGVKRQIGVLVAAFRLQDLPFDVWCERRRIPPEVAAESGLRELCERAS